MQIIPKYFRIGVYGLLLMNEKILLAKENIKGMQVVKFPGGGLQFGEGILDALKREFKEELNVEIDILQNIYINEFYVQSAIDPDYQVITLYYLVQTNQPLPENSFFIHDIQFVWKSVYDMDENFFTFETDKQAFIHLKKKLNL